MKLPGLKSENSAVIGIVLALISLSAFLVFGFAGFRTILGIILLMFLPFYLVFDAFSLSQPEKAAFSFFTSIMIYPSLVYWLGFVVPFKISIFAVFAALLIAAYAMKKFL